MFDKFRAQNRMRRFERLTACTNYKDLNRELRTQRINPNAPDINMLFIEMGNLFKQDHPTLVARLEYTRLAITVIADYPSSVVNSAVVDLILEPETMRVPPTISGEPASFRALIFGLLDSMIIKPASVTDRRAVLPILEDLRGRHLAGPEAKTGEKGADLVDVRLEFLSDFVRAKW